MRFEVVPHHVWGPAVIDRELGALIDNCPDRDSAARIAAALNDLTECADLTWATPSVGELRGIEAERVMRAMGKLYRAERQR